MTTSFTSTKLNNIQKDDVFTLRPGVIFWGENKSFYLLDKVTFKQKQINKTAYEILKLLNGNKNVNEIFQTLARNLEVSSQDHQLFFDSLIEFLERLRKEKLILEGKTREYGKKYWCNDVIHDGLGFKSPGLIYWETTKTCNYRCFFCYNPFSPSLQLKELDLEQGLSLIEKFKEIGIQTIVFTGGEPLTKKRKVVKWIQKCSDVGINSELFTNGSMIDEAMADQLAINGLNYCRISLHSPVEDEQDAISKVSGSWKHVVNAHKVLHKVDIPTASMMTVGNFNFSRLRESVEFAINLGCHGFITGPLCAVGRGKTLNEHFLSPIQFLGLIRFNLETTYVYGDQINLNWGADINMEEPWNDYVLKPLIREPNEDEFFRLSLRHLKNSICGTGVRSLGLDSTGQYIPCPVMTEIKLGNALQESIKEIWNREELKVFREKPLEEFDQCGSCGLRYSCSGGCRAYAFASTQSLTGCYTPFRDAYDWLENHPFEEVPSFYTQEELSRCRDIRQDGSYSESVETEGYGPWVPFTGAAMMAKQNLSSV